MAQILQPLKNARLVVLALRANFVLVPLLAYVIIRVIPLEQSLRIGLVVLAAAASAPFLPILIQSAKGNVAFGVGFNGGAASAWPDWYAACNGSQLLKTRSKGKSYDNQDL